MNKKNSQTEKDAPRRRGDAEKGFDIYVNWESFGYVANCPHRNEVAGHFSGPREAAKSIFGSLAKLKFIRRGHYQAFTES